MAAPRANSPFKPLWFLFALVAGLSLVTAVSKLRHAKELVPWRTDVAAAMDSARVAGKPALLYFTATWCGPCQDMKADTWSDAAVEAKLRAYVPVKIDIDQNVELALQYNSEAVPTFVVLDKDGRTIKRTSGYMTPVEFIAWIDG
jgi:thiol:disulfide interchange protein